MKNKIFNNCKILLSNLLNVLQLALEKDDYKIVWIRFKMPAVFLYEKCW